jgi:hypothetical protein
MEKIYDYAKIVNLVMSFRRKFYLLTDEIELPEELVISGCSIDLALDKFIEYLIDHKKLIQVKSNEKK